MIKIAWLALVAMAVCIRSDHASVHRDTHRHSLVGDHWVAYSRGRHASIALDPLTAIVEPTGKDPYAYSPGHLPFERSDADDPARIAPTFEDQLIVLGAYGLRLDCVDCDELRVTVPVVQVFAVDEDSRSLVATVIARVGASYWSIADDDAPILRSPRERFQMGTRGPLLLELYEHGRESFSGWIRRIRANPHYEVIAVNPPAKRMLAALDAKTPKP